MSLELEPGVDSQIHSLHHSPLTIHDSLAKNVSLWSRISKSTPTIYWLANQSEMEMYQASLYSRRGTPACRSKVEIEYSLARMGAEKLWKKLNGAILCCRIGSIDGQPGRAGNSSRSRGDLFKRLAGSCRCQFIGYKCILTNRCILSTLCLK